LTDQVKFSLRRGNPGLRLLLKGMKHVDSFLEFGHIYRTVCPAWIICPHLPDCFPKAVQYLRAFMLLPDLCLIKRETELLSSGTRKVRQPIQRVDKPNQIPRLF